MFKRRQSVFLEDEFALLSDRIEKPYRLTPFIVTFCTGTISAIEIRQLIELGLHVIRFQMSNITRRDKIKFLSMLNTAVRYYREKFDVSAWPIAISIDLPHFCIRTGRLNEEFDEHYLAKGDTVEITSNTIYRNRCCSNRIYIDDPNILKAVTEGTDITLGNGAILLICVKVVDYQTITCKVLKGGLLENKEYVCIRGVKHQTTVDLSKMDMELIKFAKEFNLDIITIKVVHSPVILKKVRALFEGQEMPLLISTICDQEGIDNADAIIKESDGIILAREFLAFQIQDIYQMFPVQLQIGAKCRKLGKPFYISGNILERTLLEGKISHGDLSDITNAVSNRAGFVLQNYNDADNLLKAVKILDSVCRSVESRTRDIEFWIASREKNLIVWVYRYIRLSRIDHSHFLPVSYKTTKVLRPAAWYPAEENKAPSFLTEVSQKAIKVRVPVNAAEACVIGCALAARQVRALLIILPTVTGRTAMQLTRIATDKIILTISSKPSVARKLQMCYGIIPIIYDKKAKKDWQEEMAARIRFAVSYGIKYKFLKYGSTYVVLRKWDARSSFADTINILTASIEDSEQERTCPE